MVIIQYENNTWESISLLTCKELGETRISRKMKNKGKKKVEIPCIGSKAFFVGVTGLA